MNFYLILYIFGVIINILNFIEVILNNPDAKIKMHMLNKKGLIITIIQMFLFSLLSWILIFIDFVYKTYKYIERNKK